MPRLDGPLDFTHLRIAAIVYMADNPALRLAALGGWSVTCTCWNTKPPSRSARLTAGMLPGVRSRWKKNFRAPYTPPAR